MSKNIVLRHQDTGLIKEAKVGFSWTNLFFGIFTPLFRGDWKWLLIQLGVGLLTGFISNLVFPFVYNKLYITDLIKDGYLPADEHSKTLLRSRNII